MKVYEHIILTKPRANAKKWTIAQREYSTELISIDETPRQTMQVYCFVGADSIEQVKEFNAGHEFIIMSPLGVAGTNRLRTLDMRELLGLSNNARVCSVTGKKVIVVHPS